jgi:uncharacterized protein involved in cysteine biosynthesis
LRPLTRAHRLSPDALMMTATWDWEGVEAVLVEAASLGLNVIRTWAFAEVSACVASPFASVRCC